MVDGRRERWSKRRKEEKDRRSGGKGKVSTVERRMNLS